MTEQQQVTLDAILRQGQLDLLADAQTLRAAFAEVMSRVPVADDVEQSPTTVGGVEIWGKTGSRPGWTSGVFATRDLSRTVVYSLNPTGLDGAETPVILRLAGAVFG